MKFLKYAKVMTAASLCAMVLAAGGQSLAAEAPRGAWTESRLTSARSELSYLEGTIEDFAVDDQGRTVWMVRRTGDPAGAPLVSVAVTADTRMDFEGNAANGDIIAVEHAGAAGSAVLTALRVTKQNPLPSVTVMGEIIEMLPAGQGSDGGFLLRPFSTGGEQDIIFRCGPETKLTVTGLAKGGRIVVTYNGILARSLPPQGYAQTISAFDAPAAVPGAQ